jgi:hypothetical protein
LGTLYDTSLLTAYLDSEANFSALRHAALPGIRCFDRRCAALQRAVRLGEWRNEPLLG